MRARPGWRIRSPCERRRASPGGGASVSDSGLAWFNALPGAEAEGRLRACCAAPVWTAAVAAGRPYPDRDGLFEHSAQVLSSLDWDQVLLALAAHPRIGERAAGPD